MVRELSQETQDIWEESVCDSRISINNLNVNPGASGTLTSPGLTLPWR